MYQTAPKDSSREEKSEGKGFLHFFVANILLSTVGFLSSPPAISSDSLLTTAPLGVASETCFVLRTFQPRNLSPPSALPPVPSTKVLDLAFELPACLPYLWRHAGLIEWTTTVALVSQIGFLFLALGLLLAAAVVLSRASLGVHRPWIFFGDWTGSSNRSSGRPTMGGDGNAPTNEFLGRTLPASPRQNPSSQTEAPRPPWAGSVSSVRVMRSPFLTWSPRSPRL